MTTSRDVLHDMQLLRDLAIANARTQAELGPLPPGGLPVEPKRKPKPKPKPWRPLLSDSQDQEDETMKLSHAAAVATLGVAGTLAACAPSTSTTETPMNEPAAQGRERPQFKLNPDPKQAYEITLKIGADAPGPFKSVRGNAEYTAPSCTYVVSEEMGARSIPEWSLPIEFKKVDDTTYVGEFYIDGMFDEDYDGPEGAPPCHWEFEFANAVLRATGADGETKFVASLAVDDLHAERAATLYFNKSGYPRERDFENYRDSGAPRSKFGPSITDADLFSATISAKKKVAP